MPSAPRLNFGAHEAARGGANRSGQPPSAPANGPTSAPALASQQNAVANGMDVSTVSQAHTSSSEQAAFFKALRQVVANTEDVGERFAHEARAMHYGDSEARSIRGQASPREAVELLQEGIDILPLPAQLKETLQ